ncbi:MAG: TonB-dependent receptor [Bryobacteraceae bacterium]|nr:TonB-dependent receptor [Bryobacteraceae bacterium]
MLPISRLFWTTLTVLLLASVCPAAPSGTILGTVKDASGAVVTGAKVTATNKGTSQSRSAITDEQGNYVLTAMPLGEYSLNSALTGFKQSVFASVTLQVDQQARVDFTLQVGDAATSIEVNTSAALLNTDASAIGQVVENKKIVDLPLNGRNFTQLAALTPGALTTQVTGQSGALTGSTKVQIAGGQSSKTEFLIDGVSSQEQGLDGVQFVPSVDAIDEFKVQSNSFAAEYGRGTAIINATIKSGSNSYHGVVFEFLRNEKLDSRNFFAATRGVYKQNQFGGTIGGPIIRNKLFFFGNYEGSRVRRGVTRNTLVPTQAFRTGNFSSLPTPLLDPLTRIAFPNNQIPANRFSAETQSLLQYIPAPNTPGGTFAYVANQPTNADQGNGRVDYQVTPSDLVYFRYSRNLQDTINPGSLPTNGSLELQSRAHNAALNYTRIISSSLINEARVGYTHLYTFGSPQGLGTNYTVQAGIRGFAETSRTFPGFPSVLVAGYGTLIATLGYRPAIAPFETRQFVDTLTYIKGRHTVKAGFDFRRFHYSEANGGTASRGIFNYGGVYSGNGFADYLLGFPNNGTRSYPTNQFGLTDKQFHYFVQDDFKVTPNLTLNIGLRYEWNTIPVPDNAQSAIFDFATGRFILATLPDGSFNLRTQEVAPIVFPSYANRIVSAEAAGLPNNIQTQSHNQFAPRFGFAYRPFGGNKTVIRGGYGIFYLLQRGNTNASYQTDNVPFIYDDVKTNTTPIPTFNTANLFDNPFAIGTPRVTTRDLKLRAPYAQQWNFSIQRQLLNNLTLDVAYVANKGNRLEQRYIENYALPGPGSAQPRRPYPEFGLGARYSNTANSIYHALQVKLEKRYSSGLTLLTSYTWSKLIDDTNVDSQSTVQDPRNLRLERAVGTFDVPHRIVTSFGYELPFGQGQRFGAAMPALLNHLVGGWQVGGIVQYQSGFPFTPQMAAPDPANVATNYARRPNRIASGKIDDWTLDRYFDVGAFQVPAAFTIGNSGRNILRGPGIANWDLSLFKNFQFGERFRLQLRGEAFNAFNRAQFNNPNTTTDPGGPGGRILSARDPRLMQVALKLYF